MVIIVFHSNCFRFRPFSNRQHLPALPFRTDHDPLLILRYTRHQRVPRPQPLTTAPSNRPPNPYALFRLLPRRFPRTHDDDGLNPHLPHDDAAQHPCKTVGELHHLGLKGRDRLHGHFGVLGIIEEGREPVEVGRRDGVGRRFRGVHAGFEVEEEGRMRAGAEEGGRGGVMEEGYLGF